MPPVLRHLPRLLRAGLLPALLLLAPGAPAAFFLRLGPGVQALEQLGGVALHSSDMRLNGRRGRLSVYGFDRAPAELLPELRTALALPAGHPAGPSLMATCRLAGQETTVLLLPGAEAQGSLVLLMAHPPTAGRPPPPTEWPGGLVYPDARLSFTAELEQTRTRLAVAATRDAPLEAAARMETILTRNGWVRIPQTKLLPGLTLFAQGNRICAFSALASGEPGAPTTITLLQRDGASP